MTETKPIKLYGITPNVREKILNLGFELYKKNKFNQIFRRVLNDWYKTNTGEDLTEDTATEPINLSSDDMEKLKEKGRVIFGKTKPHDIINMVLKEWLYTVGDVDYDALINDETINERKERKSITLYISELAHLEKVAEQRESSVQFLMRTIIRNAIYQQRFLLGDEITQLRTSNYQLAKIGTNLNQITRRVNSEIQARGIEHELAEVIAIKADIDNHIGTAKVLLYRRD